MAQEFYANVAQNLKAQALVQKIIVFRQGLQTETDKAVRRRVKHLCARAEAELAHLQRAG